MIKITNEYIDKLGASEVTKTLLKKEFTCKTSYWLARIFNEIEISSKIFISEKQIYIESRNVYLFKFTNLMLHTGLSLYIHKIRLHINNEVREFDKWRC